MKTTIKAVIKEALRLKAASIKRAMNTNRAPRFAAVYEAEMADVKEAEVWLNSQKDE